MMVTETGKCHERNRQIGTGRQRERESGFGWSVGWLVCWLVCFFFSEEKEVEV